MPVNKHCGDYCMNGCDNKFEILREEVVPRRLKEDDSIEEVKWDSQLGQKGYIYLDAEGEDKKVRLNDIVYAEQIHSDGNETNEDKPSYILNKPEESAWQLPWDFETKTTAGALRAGTKLEKGSTAIEILLHILGTTQHVEMRYGVVCTNDTDPSHWAPDGAPIITFDEVSGSTYYKTAGVERDNLLKDWFKPTFEMRGGGYFWIAIPKSAQLKCLTLIQGSHKIDYAEGLIKTGPFHTSIKEDQSFWECYRINTPVVYEDSEGLRCTFVISNSNLKDVGLGE